MSEKPGFTVFEIVNEALREVYAGATRHPIHKLADVLREQRPASIMHWKCADVNPVRSIEFDMTEQDAIAFVDNYVKSSLPNGWKFLR